MASLAVTGWGSTIMPGKEVCNCVSRLVRDPTYNGCRAGHVYKLGLDCIAIGQHCLVSFCCGYHSTWVWSAVMCRQVWSWCHMRIQLQHQCIMPSFRKEPALHAVQTLPRQEVQFNAAQAGGKDYHPRMICCPWSLYWPWMACFLGEVAMTRASLWVVVLSTTFLSCIELGFLWWRCLRSMQGRGDYRD